MATTVISLILLVNLASSQTCNFKIYRYDDSGAVAANAGYTLATVPNLQSGGSLHTTFVNWASSNLYAIQALGSWNTGNNCFYYGSSCTIAMSSSSTCSPSVSVWTASNTYFMCEWAGGTLAEELNKITGSNINGDTIAVYYSGQCTSTPVPCDFKIYRYDDSGAIAANAGYTLATLTDIKSGGSIHTAFVNWAATNNNAIQALGSWDTGNNCFYYSGPCTIAMSSSSTCSTTVRAWTASVTYYMCEWAGGTLAQELNKMTGSNIYADTIAVYYKSCISTPEPTSFPTRKPTINPTRKPTFNPTRKPTINPTRKPTINPTPAPTSNPTPAPTDDPTPTPTNIPTVNPSKNPTENPSKYPTLTPTSFPTSSPTLPTLNPTKYPTLKPSKYPTISPTKNPTVSPTLREGAVYDNTGNNDHDNTNENDTFQSRNDANLFKDNMMLFIIAGSIGFVVLCCIVFGFRMCYIKRLKKTLNKQNTNMNVNENPIEGGTTDAMTNSNIAMVRLGSASPRSNFNIMSFGNISAFEGDNTIHTNEDLAYNDNESETDDGHELFGVTGATAGGDNETQQLPDIPDDISKTNEESMSENNNELYGKQVTTGGGVDLEMYENVKKICKLCDECGKSVDVKDGKLDENDGNWYCKDCWNSFYD